MSTPSLAFTLLIDRGSIERGMARAQSEMAAGVRGMARTAQIEGRRIQSALDSITAFRSLKQQVSEARAEWERARAESTRLGTALAAVATPTRTMQREFDRARAASAAAEANFRRQSVALNALRTSMAAAGVSTTNLASQQARLREELAATESRFRAQARSLQRVQDARNVLNLGPRVNTDREIARLQAAYERLRREGNLTSAELSRAHIRMTEGIAALRNGTDSWAARLSLVREELAKLAIAGAGVGLAAREAIQFETSMTNVRKVVDFPTPQAFKELTNDLKSMSREIPVSVTSLAKIAEAGGQMGIASKDIRGFTEVVAQMSTAFNISADEAGTAVGKMMNIFALTVPQTRLLADAINHLGNNTNAVEKEIVEVMNRVGGISRVFGLANTETAALSATFLNMGLGPERAATAVNALLREMMNAPQQTDKFKTALLRIGITSEELTSKIRNGPQKAIMDLLDSLSDLDNQTKMETLVGLFGDLYSDEIVQVVNNLDKYKKNLELVSKETNFAGSMQREFAERVKTTQSQLELAKNAITEVAINFGSVFLPAIVLAAKTIASLSHGLADLAQGLVNLTERFPNLSAAVVVAVGGFAAFRSLPILFSIVGASLTTLRANLAGLATAARAFIFTPIGAVLTAASVAAYAFSKATEDAVQPLLNTAAATKKSYQETAQKIKTLEDLKNVLDSTKPGTKAHINAEEQLAKLLPDANLSLDERGRMLARVGSATMDNSAKLKEYIATLKSENRQTFALQLDAQARAFTEAKKKMADYVESLRNWYGIGTNKAQTATQQFALWMAKLTGSFDENIAEGAELRTKLDEIQGGMNAMLQEAKKADLSVQDLSKAMDDVRVDPTTKAMVVDLYRTMVQESEAAARKVKDVSEEFKQFSTAMKGPATAAKAIIIESIGVIDQQIGKYNEAIAKHRADLKKAVDDEQKSWKAMSDAATEGTKNIVAKIDEQFAAKQRVVDRKAMSGNMSERDQIRATTNLIIQANEERINESHRHLVSTLKLVNEEYNTRYATAKQLNIDLVRVDEERIGAYKNALAQRVTDYRSTIDQLISEERRHLEAFKQIEEQRRNLRLSVADKLATMQEKLMTPGQAYEDKQRRIAVEEQKARQALRDGEYENAKQHAERMISLAEQSSDVVKTRVGKQDIDVVSKASAVTTASREIRTAAGIIDEALQKQGEAHKKAADNLRGQYTELGKELEEIRSLVSKLDKELAATHQFTLTMEAKQVHEEVQKIDDLLGKKERIMAIKVQLQEDANFLDGVPAKIEQKLVGPVQEGIQKVQNHFAQFKSELSNFDPEIKAKINADAATGTINGLMTRFFEFKARVEAGASVAVDVSAAVSNLQTLKAMMANLKDKAITVTVHTVHKSSGKPKGMRTGGFLPGWGGGDRIPSLLEAGEFIMRKEAVRKYGVGMMQALNALRLQDMPRFASGGLVSRLVIPQAQVAFAGGGQVSPQVEGVVRLELMTGGSTRPTASITGSRHQIRQFTDALKDAVRGMK